MYSKTFRRGTADSNWCSTKLFYYFSLRTIHAYAGRSLRSDTTYYRGFPDGRQIPPPLFLPYWPVLGNYILGTPSYVSANRLGR